MINQTTKNGNFNDLVLICLVCVHLLHMDLDERAEGGPDSRRQERKTRKTFRRVMWLVKRYSVV